MPKKLNILLFYLIILLLSNFKLISQDEIKINRAKLTVKDISFWSKDTLVFSLYLTRTSDDWKYFANGTFHFVFDADSIIDADTVTTGITPQPGQAGGILPNSGYIFDSYIHKDRVGFTILGPEIYQNCDYIKQDTMYLLGKYRVVADSMFNSDTIKWKVDLTFDRDSNYFQALAFKTDIDIYFKNDLTKTKYLINDNVPLIYDKGKIQYSIDTVKRRYNFKEFKAFYKSDMVNSLQFTVNDDYTALSYYIVRKPQPNPPDNPFNTTEGDKDRIIVFDNIKCQGWDENFHTYSGYLDNVPYRGGSYCYELHVIKDNLKGDTVDVILAIACTDVPGLIITKVNSVPNPFYVQTRIDYELLADAYISVDVFDLLGRKLDPSTIIDETESDKLDGTALKELGFHHFIIKPQRIASQGMFNVLITATPKDKNSIIETATAVIKIRYLKSEIKSD